MNDEQKARLDKLVNDVEEMMNALPGMGDPDFDGSLDKVEEFVKSFRSSLPEREDLGETGEVETPGMTLEDSSDIPEPTQAEIEEALGPPESPADAAGDVPEPASPSDEAADSVEQWYQDHPNVEKTPEGTPQGVSLPEGYQPRVSSKQLGESIQKFNVPTPQRLIEKREAGKAEARQARLGKTQPTPEQEAMSPEDRVQAREAGKAADRQQRLEDRAAHPGPADAYTRARYSSVYTQEGERGLNLGDAVPMQSTGETDPESDDIRTLMEIGTAAREYHGKLYSALRVIRDLLVEGINDLEEIQGSFNRLR